MLEKGLPPVYDGKCRVLILGSFPSVASRGYCYYGNPRNRFWGVMGKVLGVDIPTDVGERYRILLEHGIALWDMMGSVDIVGSSDSDINPDGMEGVNDIPSLIAGGSIEIVVCNGKKSEELYKRFYADTLGLPYITMPSTSPANVSYSEEKWLILTKYLV